MNTIAIIAALWLVVVFGQQPLFAQKDSNDVKVDSMNASLLGNYNKNNIDFQKQQTADSIKIIELEARLNAAKSTDNLQKEALLKQIQTLNENQAKRLAIKKAQIDSLRQTAKGSPVFGFFQDTLFVLYSKLGSFSANDRAEAIGKRIKILSDRIDFQADSLKIIELETVVDIAYGETTIMSVSENDALWDNSTMLQLAKKYKKIIGNSVQQYKSETSFGTLAKEIGLAVLVLVMIGLLIFYVGKFFKWTALKIQRQENNWIKEIKIRNYTLFDSERQVRVLTTANTIAKWLIIGLLMYVVLPILFGIFPWTKDISETLFGYIVNPLKNIAKNLWDYLPNLITIVVIVFVFRYVLKSASFLKTEIEKGNLHLPGFYPDWANPTYQIVRVMIYAFMIVVIFPYLPGSDSPIFQGVSVFLGFLFTFGSAGSLSNIVAGLVLTYMRLFKIGDRVKIGEVVGDVIEKSLLVTRVRTIKNEIISIPNSTVMNSHTINYSSDAPEKGLIIHTTVTIGYDVPWKDMHQALIDAALRTELIMKDPEPFVLQTSLDDFYVSYQINAYVREANKQAVIYSNLHQNIQDSCNEKGIEILSPHYRAARDGNMVTIPAQYLSKDYKVPGFNVHFTQGEDT